MTDDYSIFGDGFSIPSARDHLRWVVAGSSFQKEWEKLQRRLLADGETAVIIPGGGWEHLPILDGAPVARATIHGGRVRHTGCTRVPEDAWGVCHEYGMGPELVPPRQLDLRAWRGELRRAMVDAMRAFAGPGDWTYETLECSSDELLLRSTNLPDGWRIEALWALRLPTRPPIGPVFHLGRPRGLMESRYESGVSTALRWMVKRSMETHSPGA